MRKRFFMTPLMAAAILGFVAMAPPNAALASNDCNALDVDIGLNGTAVEVAAFDCSVTTNDSTTPAARQQTMLADIGDLSDFDRTQWLLYSDGADIGNPPNVVIHDLDQVSAFMDFDQLNVGTTAGLAKMPPSALEVAAFDTNNDFIDTSGTSGLLLKTTLLSGGWSGLTIAS